MNIDYDSAMLLMKKHIGEEVEIINHTIAVSNFLVEICEKLNSKYPDMNLDVEKMRIAGLLHDIGKIRQNQGFGEHAFCGADILREEGLEYIAEIIKTHGIAKEIAEYDGIEGDYESHTIEEELLTYADAHVRHDKVVSFEERFSEVIERRKNEPRHYENLKKGFKRIRKIVDKIDKLLK